MANHRNQNKQADRSQRPAYQQVSTRPAVGVEPAQDNVRVPAPATEAESQATVQAVDERPVVEASLSNSDALPGEVTDLAGGDNTVVDDLSSEDVDHIAAAEKQAVDDGAEFAGFDEPVRAIAAPTVVSLTAQQQADADNELFPVMPRRNVMRTYIGNKWWNFFKGQEQFVPKFVRDHCIEKGIC